MSIEFTAENFSFRFVPTGKLSTASRGNLSRLPANFPHTSHRKSGVPVLPTTPACRVFATGSVLPFCNAFVALLQQFGRDGSDATESRPFRDPSISIECVRNQERDERVVRFSKRTNGTRMTRIFRIFADLSESRIKTYPLIDWISRP